MDPSLYRDDLSIGYEHALNDAFSISLKPLRLKKYWGCDKMLRVNIRVRFVSPWPD